MRVLVLVVSMLAACRSAPPAPEPAPQATRATVDEDRPDAAVVRLDCRDDVDCSGAVALVCHDDVMGGTCGPRCSGNDVCVGVDPRLSCLDGHCVFPRDGGATLPAQ